MDRDEEVLQMLEEVFAIQEGRGLFKVRHGKPALKRMAVMIYDDIFSGVEEPEEEEEDLWE